MTRVLFFLAALIVAAPAFSQTQTQQTTYCQSINTTTVSCDFTALPGSGQFILVQGQRWATTGTVTSCSDNQSNTYQTVIQSGASLNVIAFICYAMNIGSPSGTFSVTVTSGDASYWQIKGTSWSGVANTGALDTNVSSVGGPDTSASSGTTSTLAQADNLVAASMGAAAGQTSITVQSLSPAWTEQFEELSANICCSGEANTRVISTTSAQTANWTLSTSSGWAGVIAIFKSSGGGGGAPGVSTRTTLTGAGH